MGHLIREALGFAPQLLDHFGVPTAHFDRTGRLVFTSLAVRQLFGADADDAVYHAGKLARRVLEAVPKDGRESAVLTAPGLDGRSLVRAQVIEHGHDGIVVIVLFLVAASPEAALAGGRLSTREQEVARQIASGASTKVIAARLGISIHTARRHTERVFAKLGVQRRSQVMRMFTSPAGATMAS